MTTKKPSNPLAKGAHSGIKQFAKITSTSHSKQSKDLIDNGLALDEDSILTKIAEQRIKDTKVWVSHENAWK